MVKKKSNNRGVFVIIAIVIGLFILTSVVSNSLSSFERSKTNRVAVINIDTEINTQRTSTGLFMVGQSSGDIVRKINAANNDRNIDAVLFRINSPGGTPVASHEIVRAVKNLDKPSVSVIRDVGASGAYWVASATDYVVADELSLTGSVGVLGGFFDVHGLLERYNISYERFTGGEYKDLGSPFREITDNERVMLQEKIDLMHDFFLDDVISNRELDDEQVSIVSTGIYFVGIEAYNIGLVDELGSEDFAVNWLENHFNSSVTLVEEVQRTGFFNSLAGFNLNPISIGPSIMFR